MKKDDASHAQNNDRKGEVAHETKNAEHKDESRQQGKAPASQASAKPKPTSTTNSKAQNDKAANDNKAASQIKAPARWEDDE